jgi:hypothetical protein
MDDGTVITTDFSSALAGLDRLTGELRTKLARSMAVAGGTLLRDGAIDRAPVGTEEGGSKRPGLLKSSIYLAFKDRRSTAKDVIYAVTWNSKKAPHGHLVEFGHWQFYATYKGKDGAWYTDKTRKLAVPRWIPAEPFLRPTIDAEGGAAKQAMIARGAERLPELLSGVNMEAVE